MIDPDRVGARRTSASLVERLETYRDQPVDFDLEGIAAEAPAADADAPS